jgi:hypothetical protein
MTKENKWLYEGESVKKVEGVEYIFDEDEEKVCSFQFRKEWLKNFYEIGKGSGKKENG